MKEATNFVWDEMLGTWMNKKHVNTLGNVQCLGENYHRDNNVGDMIPNEIIVWCPLFFQGIFLLRLKRNSLIHNQMTEPIFYREAATDKVDGSKPLIVGLF